MTGQDAGDLFAAAVEEAQARGYRVELVRWCESTDSPGLLGAGRGVILYGPKVIRLRADLAADPTALLEVLEHELEHARRPDDGPAIDAAYHARRRARGAA